MEEMLSSGKNLLLHEPNGRLGFRICAESPVVAAEVTARPVAGLPRAFLYNSMGVTALSDVWYLPRAFDPSKGSGPEQF
jgi:hypothetical protein